MKGMSPCVTDPKWVVGMGQRERGGHPLEPMSPSTSPYRLNTVVCALP